LELESWRQPLPSVRIVTADQERPSVDVVLAAELETLEWSLRLEDGTRQHHTVEVRSLETLETRTVDGRSLQRRRLLLNSDLPWGYHHLQVEPGGEMTLIVTPGTCWLPPEIHHHQRLWGIAAQLYLLRSAQNWGIGDFGDLLRLVKLGASAGADVIGLNPLHALLESAAEHASPYSPASRLLLNVLNIDVQAIPELESSPEAKQLLESKPFGEKLAACRATSMLDYATVAELKEKALRVLFDYSHAQNSARWATFQAFRRERAPDLEKSCLFLALREHFTRSGEHQADWHNWPAEYQAHDSPEVAAFSREHAADIEFRLWLQWIAEDHLGAAGRRAAGQDMTEGQ